LTHLLPPDLRHVDLLATGGGLPSRLLHSPSMRPFALRQPFRLGLYCLICHHDWLLALTD